MKRSSCYTGAFTKRAFAALAVLAVVGAFAWTSQAAAADIGEVTIGGGIRVSGSTMEDAAPNGTSNSRTIALDSMRLYTSTQIDENISVTFNTDFLALPNGSHVAVLDAIVQFSISDSLNVWVGRHLPPSDRSNLSGPYYLGAWNYPLVATGIAMGSGYPAIFAGRDDGLSISGQVGTFGPAKVKYQVGAYQGVTGAANPEDRLNYAGRLTINLLDDEPGYYNSSTYFGEKNIFAIGLVAQRQSLAGMTSQNGLNLDVLFEKKIGDGGAFSVELAYYGFYQQGGNTVGSGEGVGTMFQVSYLTSGGLRFYVRSQEWDNDIIMDPVTGLPLPMAMQMYDKTQLDVGVDYIIKGHSARISLAISSIDTDGGSEVNAAALGVQVQF